MWKDYSSDYIKNNRSSGVSIILSALISALLLSLLCGLFYNAWKYEVERIELEEGSWQSRMIGELSTEDIETIKNFASVKEVTATNEEDVMAINSAALRDSATVHERAANSPETVINIYFYDYRTVLEDTPRIAALVGIPPETVIYNHELLAMYLVRDPLDTKPRLLFPMFILITAIAAFSLIMIIHNSFAVSMNARIHQFGIFSSIGATPKQIRTCLLQEAAALCTIPAAAGNLLGIAASMGLLQMTNILGNDIPGRHELIFGYHPLVLVLTLLVTAVTIWISAWLPARKLSRLTPLEAIKNASELQLKHKKKMPVLTLLFGAEGELAGNALKAQRKALRTASLSLILSFMAFTLMQCFFTTSEISTRETYFERYQDAWDIMVTIKDTEMDSFGEIAEIQRLPGVESAIIYQKAIAERIITEEEMSEDMKAFGGFSNDSGKYTVQTDGGWLVTAPIIILDDASFLAYCRQIGITPRLDGAVIRNRIRDMTNPDFRHPRYVPYIKEGKGENAISILRQPGNEEVTATLPILSYTEEVPVLREEYASLNYYELVHFVPVSLWKEIKEQTGGAQKDIHIRILTGENATLDKLYTLQHRIEQLISRKYTSEYENRIQEYNTNKQQIQGMKIILGVFCLLLALIGISNVFSNTLGYVRQRKKEFARYMSVGLTPKELRKMFCIEALVIAGRPVLPTLPLAVLAVRYMLKMSYLDAGEFLAEAPFVPISAFILAVSGFVALAYHLAWRSMRKINLAEVLRDDTMV